MPKKINNMSLAIKPEMHEKVKLLAKQKNIPVSKVICDLIEKCLISEDDVSPIVLKVPTNLKGDRENLQKWLDMKTAAIVKMFCD